MFEPTEKFRTVADPVTGATLSVHSGPQMEFLSVRFASPDVGVLSFELICRDTKIAPNLVVNATQLDNALIAHGKNDVAENTVLVMYILLGLGALNRKWPQMNPPILGSNYSEYEARGRCFSFAMPSDEELISLTQ